MNESLFEPIPSFDQPIAVLKHCHNRIRRRIATMQKLLTHLPEHGADEEAQKAAQSVLKYFNLSAAIHHADEEENLIPMLQKTATGADAALLEELIPKIAKDHRRMEVLWPVIALQLDDIASGVSDQLSANDVFNYAELYANHMVKEETYIAPMAMRIFSAEQMTELGEAMRTRRGLAEAIPATVMNLSEIRTDYAQKTLSEADVLDEPIAQFGRWFEEALQAEVAEPNAMSVATVNAQGRPSNRILLVKNVDARGFTWFTNYDSHKGVDLAGNPHAALLFFWHELERQVRIEGMVERISAEESDAYFHSRPLGSRLAAVASQQSQVIPNRALLEKNYAEVQAQFGDAPQRPAQWGGYRLRPSVIEFWQGRRSRFHDRIEFRLQADGTWLKQRLQP